MSSAIPPWLEEITLELRAIRKLLEKKSKKEDKWQKKTSKPKQEGNTGRLRN